MNTDFNYHHKLIKRKKGNCKKCDPNRPTRININGDPTRGSTRPMDNSICSLWTLSANFRQTSYNYSSTKSPSLLHLEMSSTKMSSPCLYLVFSSLLCRFDHVVVDLYLQYCTFYFIRSCRCRRMSRN